MLAVGATAVGTGLNTYKGFDKDMSEQITKEVNRLVGIELGFDPAKNKFQEIKFIPNVNKFWAIATHDSLVSFHGVLGRIAVSVNKIVCDIRRMSSGPRCGFGELIIPANEPGSSIMPGKVNPTQCEALSSVCCKVYGNNAAVLFGGGMGHFELHCYKPLIISCVTESTRLLSDGIFSFTLGCLAGVKPNRERIQENLTKNLMLVTALNLRIGYDDAARIANHALKNKTNLKAAALELGLQTAEEFDKNVDPANMIAPMSIENIKATMLQKSLRLAKSQELSNSKESQKSNEKSPVQSETKNPQ